MRQEQLDRHIAGAFGRVRDAVEVPPVDPLREQALLAAFDAHWARRRVRRQQWIWASAMATAAAIVAAVSLNWPKTSVTPASGGGAAVVAVADAGGFVAWPGAYALPPFESGEILRVDLPASSLPALGILTPPGPGSVIQAEIVVGQDGFARAVRFLQH